MPRSREEGKGAERRGRGKEREAAEAGTERCDFVRLHRIQLCASASRDVLYIPITTPPPPSFPLAQTPPAPSQPPLTPHPVLEQHCPLLGLLRSSVFPLSSPVQTPGLRYSLGPVRRTGGLTTQQRTSIENATVAFFLQCISCHPNNQRLMAQV